MNILDKTDEVVFYGVVGMGGEDSAFASAKAVNWGYQNVFSFRGFLDWKEAGYPVETGKE
jgi:hypothetical protein